MNKDKTLKLDIERIINYLEGNLNSTDIESFLIWLEENENNKILFADIERIWLASIEIHSNELDVESALNKLKYRIDADKEVKASVKKRKLFFFSRIAAAAVIIFSLGYFSLQHFTTNQEHLAVIHNQIIMQDGQKEKIILPDGSSVWLDSKSKLIYPNSFLNKERRVKLEGRGYFDIKKDPSKPFIVEFGVADITVLGTQFEISNYNHNDEVTAVLLSGSIKIDMKTRNDKDILLEPGEKFSYSKLNNTTSIEAIDTSIYALWANEKLTFDNEKISSIFRKLEQWYGIEIQYPEDIEETRITFTLRHESLEQLFKVISDVAPITYKTTEAGTIIVSHKKNKPMKK